MNAALMNQLKAVIASEQFKEIVKETSMVVGREVMKNAGEKLKAYAQQRIENMEDGMNSDQSFNRELSQFDNLEEVYTEGLDLFNNTFSQLEDHFDLADNELYSGFKEYKAYLEGNMTDEEETTLINKLYLLADELLDSRDLDKNIGEDNYKMLLTMMIKHSMSVSHAVYEHGQNKLTELQLKEKMKQLYENYIIAIMDFVKHNPLVREHGLTILMLAFGPKSALIQGVVITVAVTALDKEKREEMVDALNTVKSKLLMRNRASKRKETRKNKESDYENFES
ncbi:hypothetical protein GCM10007275_02970 [Jeotgalicoccus coquinae]|uniref:Uncharacterized protein n=1 Tax=Jeotgalicoccus coquinae TaxID=709509 RepID=A0A6V7R879_9STAP|nr:hypothetical protein [Jeotgalicoccus coquinae]MBB6423038.1 hypothetical protein [Jeotgalicoccus coquinae]GGE11184.1 hypothetical protein GCM10007275_02970 [Jeotgalicoccus coquinae]CAD2073496.1 hypothetical protein JEOCOQ751_00645 [Jeotgalicoccus coquinae]